MNRTNARLLAVASFTIIALVARKPALGADASAPEHPLVIDNAVPAQPVIVAPPNAPDVDAPPPAAARRPRARATIAIDEDGNATKTRNGVTTDLTPEQFYKAVGRKDLAEALHERKLHKVRMAVGGGVLIGLSAALLIGDFIYVVNNTIGCGVTVGSRGCTDRFTGNSRLASGLAIGGFAGLLAGGGVLVGSLVGIRPDAGGDDERRDLLDEYNLRAARRDAAPNAMQERNETDTHSAQPANATPRQLALRSLATLSLAPLVNDEARGVTLRMAF